MVQNIGRSELKGKCGCQFLIILHFHQLHFIPAATMCLMHTHSTLTALFAFRRKEFGGCQLIHTIVEIDNYPAAHNEITSQQYEYDTLFHR